MVLNIEKFSTLYDNTNSDKRKELMMATNT